MLRRGTIATGAVAWLLTVGCAPEARSDDDGDASNRIEFQVERSRRVANDRVQAVVGVTDEDVDAAVLADRVNRAMTWALETARANPAVEARSGGYRTSPISEKGKLRRWRASHDLVLESGDVAAVSELVGTLQSRLQLRGMSFSVSNEKRREVEDGLIEAALAAFRARAELVRKSLDKRGYEIVRASVYTAGAAPIRSMRAESAMLGARVTAPALEGGRSEISVRVNGTIELY
jgi:predicted secreted protein